MCIIVGPVKPANTILLLKGLRQGVCSSSSESTTPTSTSPHPVQVQLIYINDLNSDKEKKITGGVMIVPIAYTDDVKLKEEDDIVPFFVDVKGENIATLAQKVETAVVVPPRRQSRGASSNSASPLASSAPKLRSALEVVELKEGGYNCSFAPNLEDLKDRIDIKKLNLSEEEWTSIYANTKLRFGAEEKEKKDSYGFVVAVPRIGSGALKRTGFSLVYWSKKVEFPTVHEQNTKTATPIEVDMDASLVGLNIAINIESKDKKQKVRYLVDEKRKWDSLRAPIKELPTSGILHSKPKPIFSCDTNFVSFYSFKGKHLNINVPATFISGDQVKAMAKDAEKVLKLESSEKVLQFQKELTKALGVKGQEKLDITRDDDKDYVSYMGLQMVLESHLTGTKKA